MKYRYLKEFQAVVVNILLLKIPFNPPYWNDDILLMCQITPTHKASVYSPIQWRRHRYCEKLFFRNSKVRWSKAVAMFVAI